MKNIDIKSIYIGNICKIQDVNKSNNTQNKRFLKWEITKENAVLLRVCEHGYIDIENINNYFTYLSIKKRIHDDNSFNISEFILPDIYNPNGLFEYFIDKSSLKNCFVEEEYDISYKTIKKLRKIANNKENLQ